MIYLAPVSLKESVRIGGWVAMGVEKADCK